jgi:hypothetical protein
MNDFFGQPLSIGDTVAFMRPSYRDMVTGKITKFTPQTIVIEWKHPFYTELQTFRATSSQVIKKPK